MPPKNYSSKTVVKIAKYLLFVTKYRIVLQIAFWFLFFNLINFFILNPINKPVKHQQPSGTECCEL